VKARKGKESEGKAWHAKLNTNEGKESEGNE